jgi:hypothetical protein
MTVKEFIKQVFLIECKRLIDSGYHYISFALIGLGIEFLGACVDGHDFAKPGKSEQRFTLAIRSVFPSKYHGYAKQLYADLRSGFAHQFRPASRFVLTHRAESVREGTRHLGPFGKQTVLVAEDLYGDFERASRQVITWIDDGTLSHKKLLRGFLKITDTGAVIHSSNITEKIRRRAYALYEARGRHDGHDLDDWLKAEAEITAAVS